MYRRLILMVVTVVVIPAYLWVYQRLFALGAVYLLRPSLLHEARQVGGTPMLLGLHAMATLLLNVLLLLPVAILIVAVFRRWRLTFAAGAAIWLLAPEILAAPRAWEAVADHREYLAVLAMGVIAVFAALLGWTYLTSRITSNLRWRGRAASSSPSVGGSR